jgi:hypothetical protein
MILSTFYIESPDHPYTDLTITARVQSPSGSTWSNDESLFQCDVANASYDDGTGQRRRYKIDLRRCETSTWHDGQDVWYYPLHKAGVYRRRLQVLCNGIAMLERMLYVTVQPNLHVYVEDGSSERIDLIHTEETIVSENPLVKTLTVVANSDAEAVAAKTVLLTQPNAYKGKVCVRSNVPVDLVSNDLTEEGDEYSSKWLQLKDQIIVTRGVRR